MHRYAKPVPLRKHPAPIGHLRHLLHDGGDAAGDSQNAVISGNGRFVAFDSTADDLVAGLWALAAGWVTQTLL